jgi:bacteriocin biosynthesis cyclodehydratase domain-containing protein
LLRGISLIHNRRRPSHYVVGNALGNSLNGTEGVVAVTSAFERSALLQIGEGVNPFLHVGLHQRDELVKFLEALSARGFLNRNPAQLKSPKRYFEEIDSSDLAAQDFQLRANPELLQSEWIDGASDGGVTTVAARALYPILLSGRSRVITLLYSMLLASGVTRVRFADRYHRSAIESCDLGFGAITHEQLGQNFYEQSESARRALSLFPIDSATRHDLDSSAPIAVIHYGDCDPVDLVEWSNKRTPHFVIHQPIGDEIAIGPMVIPGESPCIRCLSLYEIDNFGYTRLERIDISGPNELPAVTAHYVAAVTASQILHFIDQHNSSAPSDNGRNTGIGEVTYLNFQRLTEPQVVAIARHPLCGCDY